jgi:hypothetical protein
VPAAVGAPEEEAGGEPEAPEDKILPGEPDQPRSESTDAE